MLTLLKYVTLHIGRPVGRKQTKHNSLVALVVC